MILAARYEIVRPLAQGGFGKTFLACDRYLPGHPHCVIKQLHLTHETPKLLKTAQRLFNLEAQTLYQLGTHAQIPTLLAHFEEGRHFYLVQEYVAGVLLQDAFECIEPVYVGSQVQARPARVEQTVAVLRDLLGVLAFVHGQKVIHRDVKPANIIRREVDGQLVLIDFGAVKTAVTAMDAGSTVAIGSPGYIAPEQQAGRPCFASDLYAVGMVGAVSLTGVGPQGLPVDAVSGQLQLRSVVDVQDEKVASLLAFLERLSHRHPSDRFADASIALQALEGSLHLPLSRTVQKPMAQKPMVQKPVAQKPMVQAALASQTSLPPTRFSPTLPPQDVSIQSPVIPLSASDYRNRQALKNKVHRFWIQGVLNHSLHGQVLLTLGLEERVDALALPWNIS